VTKLTKDEAIERIEGVLKAAGIKLELATTYDGCDFIAEFPDGAKYEGFDVGVYIKCDGLSHQRG
jgi:hypothetical protein